MPTYLSTIHYRRRHNPGQRVQVADCSGIDSGRTGTVVTRVPWRTCPGLYQAPDCNQDVCVRLDVGHTTYFPAKRLLLLE